MLLTYVYLTGVHLEATVPKPALPEVCPKADKLSNCGSRSKWVVREPNHSLDSA